MCGGGGLNNGPVRKKPKVSQQNKTNGLSSFNGHHDRSNDTEEDTERRKEKSKRARSWGHGNVRQLLVTAHIVAVEPVEVQFTLYLQHVCCCTEKVGLFFPVV